MESPAGRVGFLDAACTVGTVGLAEPDPVLKSLLSRRKSWAQSYEDMRFDVQSVLKGLG